MPYIPPAKRERLYDALNALVDTLEEYGYDEGELNYVFFVINKNAYTVNPKYATINKIIGAMECSKQEFYRTIAGPHEDDAIQRNGNI
jgi:hypothetical protein